MSTSQPTGSPRARRVVWVGLSLGLVLFALIAYPYWLAMEERQERIETEWTGTLFLDIYLRNQVVPSLLLAPGFPPSTAEARLTAMERQYGNPLRRYRILEWHFGDAVGNQVADLYYEVDFKKNHRAFAHPSRPSRARLEDRGRGLAKPGMRREWRVEKLLPHNTQAILLSYLQKAIAR